MNPEKIYSVVQTDDFSPSHEKDMGYYSTRELAQEALNTLARNTPDFYNYKIVSYPLDYMFLPL